MELMHLVKINGGVGGKIRITGSKSESNRLLILQQLFPGLTIENCSNSDDSKVLKKALESKSSTIDIGHAGTAMRFLTAYFACQKNRSVILTGSDRMKERPIALLVDALNALGADVTYVEKVGYPPLKIHGTEFQKDRVAIRGDVSSQYITALMLIAPSLPNGLTIEFSSELTSIPYVEMTLQLLVEAGIKYQRLTNGIQLFPTKEIPKKTMIVESDWSSASYFYSLVALNPGAQLELSAFKLQSLQGDAVLATLYEQFGVSTSFKNDTIILKNVGVESNKGTIDLDLRNAPDIAQTIAVTCFGLGLDCHLKGLHTLKIKETDRLQALKTEIEKLGGKVTITRDTLTLEKREQLREQVSIATYKDHRMAMAFAPLASLVPIIIESPDVVGKSYPDFWTDFRRITN